MIRATGPGKTAPASAPRKGSAARAGGEAFRVGEAARNAEPSGAAACPPAETLGALIALQSGGGRQRRSRLREVAAAQRVLDLLDRVRLGVLDGACSDADLDALATASRRPPEAVAEELELNALIGEIALRARVELAKRGR